MAEYIDRTLLEPDTEWSDYYDGFVSYSQSQIQDTPKADVIERSEYEKIKFERDISVQQIHDLGNSVSKAIEELQARADMFNKIGDSNNACTTRSALEILERNIGE